MSIIISVETNGIGDQEFGYRVESLSKGHRQISSDLEVAGKPNFDISSRAKGGRVTINTDQGTQSFNLPKGKEVSKNFPGIGRGSRRVTFKGK